MLKIINVILNDFKNNKILSFLSFIFLMFSLYIFYYTGLIVKNRKNVIVGDILLNNLPFINLSYIFVYFFIIILLVYFLYPLINEKKFLHRYIFLFSLLLFTRSIFISMTYLKTPAPPFYNLFPSILEKLNFVDDLFFSGHVAFTFLGYLTFYENKKLRYFFLFSTIIMIFTTLLMKVHYSIDVFSALYITYGTFILGDKILKKIEKSV